MKKHLILAAATLSIMSACTPPEAISVLQWNGESHRVSASTSQGSGLSGVHYIVKIGDEVVVDDNIPRSEQQIDNGVIFRGHGEFQGKPVISEYRQTATFGQTYISHHIYVDEQLVGVVSN